MLGAAAVNSNGFKTFIANGASTFFVIGKPTLINGGRKLPSNPLFRHVIFPLIPFNKISLFSKDLITFIIFFISLFVSVIPKNIIFLTVEGASTVGTIMSLLFLIGKAAFTAGAIMSLSSSTFLLFFLSLLLDFKKAINLIMDQKVFLTGSS